MFGKSATEATTTTSEENGGEGVGGRRGGHICREAKGMWRLGGKGADSRSLDLLADERHVEAALPSFNGRFGWRKCRRRSFGKPPSISFLSWWWAGGGGGGGQTSPYDDLPDEDDNESGKRHPRSGWPKDGETSLAISILSHQVNFV